MKTYTADQVNAAVEMMHTMGYVRQGVTWPKPGVLAEVWHDIKHGGMIHTLRPSEVIDFTLERGPRNGVVRLGSTDNSDVRQAQQQAQEGEFRKRATRYRLKNGRWSEWCKDDHDIFVPDVQS